MSSRQRILQGDSLLRQHQRMIQGLGVHAPTPAPLSVVGPTQPSVRLRILWVQSNGFLPHLPRLDARLFCEAPKGLHLAQVVIIGFQVVGAFPHHPSLLPQRELQL